VAAEKDVDRVLTKKGKEQARMCGKYLRKVIRPTEIVHSTMKRAAQTAQIITQEIKSDCPVEVS